MTVNHFNRKEGKESEIFKSLLISKQLDCIPNVHLWFV